jgi:hypothetical protein
MLLKWHKIDASFLPPAFHICSNAAFVLAGLNSFPLAISIELLRICQRDFDRYFRARSTSNKKYVAPEENEGKLLESSDEGEVSGADFEGLHPYSAVCNELLRDVTRHVYLISSARHMTIADN